MVTAYYILKMQQSYKDFYNARRDISSLRNVYVKTRQKCRICLREGCVPIRNNKNTSEVLQALQIFANISLYEDNRYPQQLCKGCYNFIKGAILFRKIAKKSTEALENAKNFGLLSEDEGEHDNSFSNNFNYHQSKQVNKPIKIETKESQEDSSTIHNNYQNKEENSTLTFTTKIEIEPLEYLKVEEENESEKMTKHKKVKCGVCGAVVTSSYYKFHMTKHDPNHPRYVCGTCNKSFKYKCQLTTHTKYGHRTDFPFKCKLCPYKAKHSSYLVSHMKRHAGIKKYMCSECPDRFTFRPNLLKHMLRHRAPQHKCETCNKAFYTKSALVKHNNINHLGIKNFVCDVCGKTFGSRYYMLRHKRTIHKDKNVTYIKPSYLEVEMQENSETSITSDI